MDGGGFFSTIFALVVGIVVLGLLVGAMVLVALVVAGLWIAVTLAYYAVLIYERVKR